MIRTGFEKDLFDMLDREISEGDVFPVNPGLVLVRSWVVGKVANSRMDTYVLSLFKKVGTTWTHFQLSWMPRITEGVPVLPVDRRLEFWEAFRETDWWSSMPDGQKATIRQFIDTYAGEYHCCDIPEVQYDRSPVRFEPPPSRHSALSRSR